MPRDWDDVILTEEEKELAREAAERLEQFLMSDEGKNIRQTLERLNTYIIFGEGTFGGGYGSVIYLEPEGIKKSHEAMGTWVVYSNVRPPRISPASAFDAVEAMLKCQNKKSYDAIGFVREALTRIPPWRKLH